MDNQAGIADQPTDSAPTPGTAMRRTVSASTWKAFAIWTAIFWGATGGLGLLFFAGVLDFSTSTKTSLYGTSIWLNGCLIPLLLPGAKQRPKLDLLHDCLVIWLVSYTMTNLLWEIPWIVSSPFLFDNLHTLDDIVAHTEWMRESVVNMYWWIMASFGSVDLRTVNHNSTFYALEFFAFFNVASAYCFYRLNKRRSALRYLIPVMGGGEAIAATFIFTFSEVFAKFENMSGGGGGKALNHLISTADRQEKTMLVNSTPIIIRSLTGVFPQSFRDLTPIANEAFRLSVEQLEEIQEYVELDDLLRLVKRLARNGRNFEKMLNQLESVMDLAETMGPLANEAFGKAVHELTELERKGYFTFVQGGMQIMDNVVTSFSEEDVSRFGDNVVLILNTVKEMTQPEIMNFVRNTLLVAEKEIDKPVDISYTG